MVQEMKLRELKAADAERMLEWMRNPSVVEKLRSNFASKTIEDCLGFIAGSISDNSVNYAVTGDDDLYMGTVSLKDIKDGAAEFAIVMHPDAFGKGYGSYAMKAVIEKGFRELGLNCIYWCVDPENVRAVRFYDKNGYRRVSPEGLPAEGNYSEEEIEKFLWYVAEPGNEFEEQ